MSISATELKLHRARMLYIKGDVDNAISIYKEIIEGYFNYAQQDPAHSQYYVQYGNMLLEEAKAMRESQRVPPPLPAKPQNSTSYSSVDSATSFDYPNQSFSPSPYSGVDTRHDQPRPTSFPPIEPHQQDSQLTMSDVYQAAAGVGRKLKKIDDDYKVSQTCKDVATACVNKAKELDREYEIREKAVQMGHQIKAWDERNGVSKAIVNGVQQVAGQVTTAIKGMAEQNRANSYNPQ